MSHYGGFIWTHQTKFLNNNFSLSKLSSRDDAAQLNEVSILRYLANEQKSNPSLDVGIIDLVDFFKSMKSFHLVMELAEGGDVFDRLAKRKVYTEKDARDLARRMLESIQFVSFDFDWIDHHFASNFLILFRFILVDTRKRNW